MDLKQIKEIARTMKENGLTLVEITEGEASLRMERQGTAANTAENISPLTSHILAEKEGVRPALLPVEDLNVFEVKSPGSVSSVAALVPSPLPVFP